MVHSYKKKMIPFTPTASDTTCFEIFDQDRLLTLLRSNNCLQTACTYIMDTLKCSGGSVYFRVKGDEGLATLKILTKAQFYAEFPALTNGPDKIIAQCWRSFKIICSPLEISCDNNRLLLNIYEPSIYEYILREPNVSELTSFCLTRVESMFKMLCNNVDRVVTYFATWLWLILQGHRQISAAALSGQGGDGKSAIANGFRNLLPDRVCTTLDRNDFGLFNSKKDNKMFCMCEEWDPKVSSSVINNLKNSITEGIVSSRSVGQNSVDVKNVSNFLITSNYDISYLTGRKFFHINVPKLSMEKDEEIEYKTFCRRMSGGDALISEEDYVHHRSICEALYLFLSRFDGKPLDNIPPECISTEQTSAIPPRPHPTRSSTEILDAFLASKYFDTISKLYNTGTLYGTSMISFPSKEIKDALKIFYTNRSASNYEYPLIDAHHLEAQFDNYLAGIGFMRTKRSSNFFDISILTPYYYLSEHWTSAPQSKLDWQRNLATNGFNELKRQIETQKDLDKFSVQNQNPENQI